MNGANIIRLLILVGIAFMAWLANFTAEEYERTQATIAASK